MEIYLQSFLSSPICGNEWSVSPSGHYASMYASFYSRDMNMKRPNSWPGRRVYKKNLYLFGIEPRLTRPSHSIFYCYNPDAYKENIQLPGLIVTLPQIDYADNCHDATVEKK
jgi:hypothetical protein